MRMMNGVDYERGVMGYELWVVGYRVRIEPWGLHNLKAPWHGSMPRGVVPGGMFLKITCR